MSLLSFCTKCILNASSKHIYRHPCRSYKSIYSIDQLYPGRNPDIIGQNRPEATKTGFTGFIPVEKLEIKALRGSGPGGQNVHMTNNKVEIRFHVQTAEWIPEDVKQRFIEQEKHRINKDGYFVTTSHKTRQMLLNQGDCINKIRTAVFNSMKVNEPPTEEYLKEVQRRQEKAQRERIRQKKEHSLKKRDRQKF